VGAELGFGVMGGGGGSDSAVEGGEGSSSGDGLGPEGRLAGRRGTPAGGRRVWRRKNGGVARSPCRATGHAIRGSIDNTLGYIQWVPSLVQQQGNFIDKIT
jgi:hypothetical protein